MQNKKQQQVFNYAKDVFIEDIDKSQIKYSYFEIHNLQHLETFTNEDTYGVSDFVVPPKKEGRAAVTVKLGMLLITYSPNGKASFSTEIKLIDAKNKKTSEIFSYNGKRKPDFAFEDLVPILLSEYYGNATIYIKALTPEIIAIRAAANKVKSYIITMALNKSVDLNDFHKVCRDFFDREDFSIQIQNNIIQK